MGKGSVKDGHKKVPTYWWDLDVGNTVIVESDDDRFPIVARFKYDPNEGDEPTGEAKIAMREFGLTGKCGCASPAIEKAEAYIEDLKAGRANPRKLFLG